VVVQDGKIKFLNKSVGITGYRAEEVIGRHFLEIVADEDKERIMENYRKMMERKAEGKPRKYKFKFKDGTIGEIEIYPKRIEFEGRPALLVIARQPSKSKSIE
jgi:PAS domain S-box-containing protein